MLNEQDKFDGRCRTPMAVIERERGKITLNPAYERGFIPARMLNNVGEPIT
jgi:hypothetical protein